MNDGKVDWQGNLPAVVTPFAADHQVDEGRFAENVEWLLDEGADGVVVSGCTGEAWSLTAEERLRLFRLAADIGRGRATVIGGTGDIATPAVVELSQAAKATGIDGVMILPPYYAQPTPAELVAHYRTISDALRFPMMLYNIPERTGLNLKPALLERLAAIDWVVALKESYDDFVQLEATVAHVGERIRVFSGFAATRGMPAIVMGCHGLISSMDAHIMGRDAIALYALAHAGDVERARPIQQKALRLVKSLHAYGSEASVLKAAMNLLGRPGGHVRPPLLDLDGENLERVRDKLADHDLLK